MELEKSIENIKIQREQEVRTAKALLDRKYDKEFKILRVSRISLLDSEIWVEAAETEREEVRFIAKINVSLEHVADQYFSRLLSKKLEDTFTQYFVKKFAVFSVKAGLADKWISAVDINGEKDLDEALDAYSISDMNCTSMVYLDILQEEKFYSAGEIYVGVLETIKEFSRLSGRIMISVVDKDVFIKLLVYLREHANVNQTYHDIKADSISVTIPFENGRLLMAQDEFSRLYREG